MSVKRYSGTGFTEISSRKRWNGSAWVALTVGKRWNGAAWVDLWSNSSGGGGSDAVSGSGSISKVSSTVSTPTVNYSGSYTWSKSGDRLTVPVTFRAWISKSAKLGSGILLTVYARLNGGAWESAVIKSSGAVWQNSAATHSASITLNGAAKSSNTIEWYVTRAGSSYRGTAGSLGSASKPKKHTFDI